MSEKEENFICPTCRRQLGSAYELPENCPRCNSELALLKNIISCAENFFKQGIQLCKKDKFAEASSSFKKACTLWNIEKYRQAFKLANLAKISAKNHTYDSKKRY